MSTRSSESIPGWNRLRHSGLLLDGPRLVALRKHVAEPLDERVEQRLRQRAAAVLSGAVDGPGTSGTSEFVSFVLEQVCGFGPASGGWERGGRVPASRGRRAVTGEMVKPRHLWGSARGASLPVFIDDTARIGIGRGRRVVSRVLGWLRSGGEHLALVTNGRQWRLVFAGLDYDASCEWDADLWFEEGELTAQVTALRTLLCPELWTPEEEGAASPLLQAIRDTRKGQAELSEVLGERVREAVEILVRSHGEALKELAAGENGVEPADIYRAACRVAMRAVVVLFAESRDLLPRDNTVYDEGYGLNGLFGQLERRANRGDAMSESYGAWPRVLALFRLVNEGSHHPDLPVAAYGGELFAPGRADDGDGVSRALHVFETACFGGGGVSDRKVYDVLRLLTRTRARIRQGHGGMWVPVPVDFSDLSSEYIGVVYEGLLDYELKTAPAGDPVIFLSVGDRPALPLSRLEGMDRRALRGLFEKLKKDVAGEGRGDEEGRDEASEVAVAPSEAGAESAEDAALDERRTYRTRAEKWARRAVEVAGLARKPRSQMTPKRRLAYEGKLAATLVHQQVLPGEWYLARWGGTRKGSGSFYTRPGLAVPTVQRTLRPLAYDPPRGKSRTEAQLAPSSEWTPKRPEEILALKVCDPACGSGSFVLAALRFLTDALYESLQRHGRIEAKANESLVWLLGMRGGEAGEGERLSDDQIPCRPDDDEFERLLKARLRRHVVERSIYAVDLDPLAVELCRLSLWIETMDRELPFGFLDHKVKCGNALVGAWFDQFQHYPAMAWKNREGGDKGHSNGVHFGKNARGRAIKAFHKNRLTPDMKRFLEGRTLFQEDLLEKAVEAHGDSIEVLAYMRDLPIHDAAERADVYRKELLGSPEWRSLKEAMDLWCACWFWPADEIEHAPLPTRLADPSAETRAVAREVAVRHRFFHWELEFPDVFRKEATGFDAVLGNPPWDIAKPLSMEFFANIDPLYRSYGNDDAPGKQREYFTDEVVERAWLDYCADFRAQSNYVSRARNPFGDPDKTDKSESKNRFYLGAGNLIVHRRWRTERLRSSGFADQQHPFLHQGSADLNLYKLFLEVAHAMARAGGRVGFLVPSGLYSDAGTEDLRKLFLTRCRWEWLFGIENSARVFPTHRSLKFNPVVIEKGGSTDAIQAALMRNDLQDWERAEDFVTPYTRAQVERFSPKNHAILEIQSRRELEILEKIYADSVLLGDDGPNGWGIKYVREFDMKGDSKLFPPRPKWEASGYRPDEYSRWLKGDWRPIGELWAELGVDPNRPVPAEIKLDDQLFDTSADPERREAEARFVHGHLLKPGDVARTDWEMRCAQPPYDRLPVPRVAIPPGVILSRDGTRWIREGAGIEGVALPLYEGRMIGQFDFSEKGWVSGKGRSAVWRNISWERKQIEPQFLMTEEDYHQKIEDAWRPKVAHMRTASATNVRTAISALICGMPAGDKAATLIPPDGRLSVGLTALYNSFAFDFVVRTRTAGLSVDYHVLQQSPVFQRDEALALSRTGSRVAARMCLTMPLIMPTLFELLGEDSEAERPNLTSPLAPAERLRLAAMLDAAVAAMYGLSYSDLQHILYHCDLPSTDIQIQGRSRNQKGFWRIDKDRDPELRHTVLTLVALRDLESRIREASGNRDDGIRDFFAQNGGEGWLLPETLRLADYGLGHDDRARERRSLASRLGPRFFDWQLTRSHEESWRECHLHARNLLGRVEYVRLLNRLTEHRVLSGERHDDLLLGQFTRDLVGGDTVLPTPTDGTASGDERALRAAEPKPNYSADPSGKRPQTEMFRGPQSDLFE